MYCNSESVNKPSHPSPPTPHSLIRFGMSIISTHMPSALCILKCFFFYYCRSDNKNTSLLKKFKWEEKSFSANISHTQQFTKCTQQFCMDLLYSKQPCPHYHRQYTCIHTHTHHPNTHTYTRSLATMVVVQSTYLVSVSLVSILCVWYCAQYWHIEKRNIASNCQQFNNYYGNSNKHVQERITKKECMIQQ